MPAVKNLSGARFGRLVAIERSGTSGTGKAVWRCRCDCGEEVSAISGNLCSGLTRSCGCLARERQAEQARNRSHKHGNAARGRQSPEYRSWAAMIRRCRYACVTGFADYGGRGITVCDRWQKFENFLADMGPKPTPKHSVERGDNDGNYEPGNCRWATAKEQRANQRPRPARGRELQAQRTAG